MSRFIHVERGSVVVAKLHGAHPMPTADGSFARRIAGTTDVEIRFRTADHAEIRLQVPDGQSRTRELEGAMAALSNAMSNVAALRSTTVRAKGGE